MPLPLTVYCFSKIQIGLNFLVPAHPGSPGQRSVKQECVSWQNRYLTIQQCHNVMHLISKQTRNLAITNKSHTSGNVARTKWTSYYDKCNYNLVIKDVKTLTASHTECWHILDRTYIVNTSNHSRCTNSNKYVPCCVAWLRAASFWNVRVCFVGRRQRLLATTWQKSCLTVLQYIHCISTVHSAIH